jgi:hypothetical protein
MDEQFAGDLTRDREARLASIQPTHVAIAEVVGIPRPTNEAERGSIRQRLVPASPGRPAAALREDRQARVLLARADAIRDLNTRAFDDLQNTLTAKTPDVTRVKAEYATLRDELVLLAGEGQLPARNVANLGYLLYTDHLLAVELAGTLLLVATVGAIAIAQRKGVAAP